MTLAGVAILPFLGRASLWNDEGFSLAFARLPWPVLWNALHHLDAVFALYYALLHVWLAAGSSAFVVRLPSALAVLASLPVGYAVARKLFGPVAAAITAVLLALNPFLIAYAKDARPYALVFLLSLCATLYFLRLLETPARTNALAYATFATLAIYMHALAALVIVAHVASAFVLPRAPAALRALALSLAGTALLCVPLGLLVHAAGSSQIDWIPRPGAHDWFLLVRDLAGGRVALIAFAIACVALVRVALVTGSRAAFAAAVLWCAVPLVLLAVLSYAVEPVSLPRYVIFCTFPIVLLTSSGISTLRAPLPVAAATLLLVLVSGRIVWSQHALESENYRAAVAYIAAHASPEDAVAAPDAFFAYQAALAGAPEAGPPIVYPTPAWKFWLGPQPLAEAGLAPLARARTLWLVVRGYHDPRRPPPADVAFDSVVARDFTPAGETDFGYAGVVRYVRKEAATAPPRS
jgi:mannosyltransferase